MVKQIYLTGKVIMQRRLRTVKCDEKKKKKSLRNVFERKALEKSHVKEGNSSALQHPSVTHCTSQRLVQSGSVLVQLLLEIKAGFQ